MSSVVVRPPEYAPNVTTGSVLTPAPTVFELSPFIGPPLQTVTVRPGMNVRMDLTTLGNVMEGRVTHLAVFLTGLFRLTENNFIFNLFPIRQLGDVHWMTTTYNFESSISVENPSQVAPPFGSYTKNVQSGTLTRFAWGVQMLIDVLKTPEGVMIYEALTVQCLQAFVRALEALCLTAIMNTRAQYQHFWLEASDFTVKVTSRAAIENKTFNALKKYPDAATRLLNLAQDNFSQSQRGRATAVIVHQGFRSLVTSQKTMTEYKLRGPGNQQYADLRADAPDIQEYLPGTDVKLYVAAPINASGQGVFKDVLKRKIQFGGWQACDNYGWDRNPLTYRSTWTNISPFNMALDNFDVVTIKNGLYHCGRFDASEAGNLVTAHKTLADQARNIAIRSKLPIVDNRVDMFVYSLAPTVSSKWSDVTHYGQMEKWALKMDIVHNHAITMRSYLYRKIDGDVLKRFLAGAKYMERLKNLPISADDVAFGTLAAGPIAPGSAIGEGHFAGGPLLPGAVTLRAVGAGNVDKRTAGMKLIGGYEPRFFGSAGGMFTLALEDRTSAEFAYIAPAAWDAAAGFYDGIISLYAAFLEIYGTDHVLLSAAYAPSTFVPSSIIGAAQAAEYRAYLTFANNIVGGNPPIVMIDLGAAAPAAAVLTGDWASLNDARVDLSPAVKAVLFDNNAVKTFADRFNAGSLGTAYRTYVAAKNARAAVAQIQVPPMANPFSTFVAEEIVKRFEAGNAKYNSWVVNRVFNHLLPLVERNADYAFSKETLDALAQKSQYTDYATVSGVVSQDAGAYTSTRLVASSVRVSEYTAKNNAVIAAGATGGTKIALSSTLNPGRAAQSAGVVDAGYIAQQQMQTDDLSGLVVASSARPGSGGARAQQPRAPFQLSADRGPFTGFAEIGTDIVTDAYGRSFVKVNENLMKRLEAVKSEADLLLRMSATMLLTAPVQRRALCKMYDEDIILPVALWLPRPYRTYEAVGMVFLAVNDDLGMAAFAFPDVRRQVDAVRKITLDHYSMCLGVAVMDGGRILTMPDTALCGYDGGETIDPILPQRPDDPMPSSNEGSMFYILGPAGEFIGGGATAKPTMDIKGKFPHQITQYAPADRQSADFISNAKPHYSSVFFTWMIHGFENHPERVLSRDWKFGSIADKRNTIVARELGIVNLVDGVRHGVTPADMMGYDVYPGVASMRGTGAFPEVVQSNYHNRTEFLPF